MNQVSRQLKAGKYTVLCFDNPLPSRKGRKIVIDGIEYLTETVFDLPDSIAIMGNGSFVGKTVRFV